MTPILVMFHLPDKREWMNGWGTCLKWIRLHSWSPSSRVRQNFTALTHIYRFETKIKLWVLLYNTTISKKILFQRFESGLVVFYFLYMEWNTVNVPLR